MVHNVLSHELRETQMKSIYVAHVLILALYEQISSYCDFLRLFDNAATVEINAAMRNNLILDQLILNLVYPSLRNINKRVFQQLTMCLGAIESAWAEEPQGVDFHDPDHIQWHEHDPTRWIHMYKVLFNILDTYMAPLGPHIVQMRNIMRSLAPQLVRNGVSGWLMRCRWEERLGIRQRNFQAFHLIERAFVRPDGELVGDLYRLARCRLEGHLGPWEQLLEEGHYHVLLDEANRLGLIRPGSISANVIPEVLAITG